MSDNPFTNKFVKEILDRCTGKREHVVNCLCSVAEKSRDDYKIASVYNKAKDAVVTLNILSRNYGNDSEKYNDFLNKEFIFPTSKRTLENDLPGPSKTQKIDLHENEPLQMQVENIEQEPDIEKRDSKEERSVLKRTQRSLVISRLNQKVKRQRNMIKRLKDEVKHLKLGQPRKKKDVKTKSTQCNTYTRTIHDLNCKIRELENDMCIKEEENDSYLNEQEQNELYKVASSKKKQSRFDHNKDRKTATKEKRLEITNTRHESKQKEQKIREQMEIDRILADVEIWISEKQMYQELDKVPAQKNKIKAVKKQIDLYKYRTVLNMSPENTYLLQFSQKGEALSLRELIQNVLQLIELRKIEIKRTDPLQIPENVLQRLIIHTWTDKATNMGTLWQGRIVSYENGRFKVKYWKDLEKDDDDVCELTTEEIRRDIEEGLFSFKDLDQSST